MICWAVENLHPQADGGSAGAQVSGLAKQVTPDKSPDPPTDSGNHLFLQHSQSELRQRKE